MFGVAGESKKLFGVVVVDVFECIELICGILGICGIIIGDIITSINVYWV